MAFYTMKIFGDIDEGKNERQRWNTIGKNNEDQITDAREADTMLKIMSKLDMSNLKP